MFSVRLYFASLVVYPPLVVLHILLTVTVITHVEHFIVIIIVLSKQKVSKSFFLEKNMGIDYIETSNVLFELISLIFFQYSRNPVAFAFEFQGNIN